MMPNSVIRLNTYPCLVTMPSGCRGDGCAWGSSGDPRWWKLSRISCRPYRPSYLVLPIQPNFREVSIGGQICGMGIPVGLLHQSAHWGSGKGVTLCDLSQRHSTAATLDTLPPF